MHMLLVICEYFVLAVFFAMLVLDTKSLIAKRELYKKDPKFNPRILVIVPAKGYDLNQRENFLSLQRQHCRNYDVVAIVDAIGDYAAKTALNLGIRTEVAKGRCMRCSGKNRAIAYALNKFRDYDVYVIADSDVISF